MSYSSICCLLECPICHHLPSDASLIDLQCHFSDQIGENFYIGDSVYLSKDPDYVMLRPWSWPNKFVVLEEWVCEQSHEAAGHLWARVTIEDQILTRVEPVILSKEVLNSVDGVTRLSLFYFSGEPDLSVVANLPPEEFKIRLLQAEAEFLEDQARAYAEIGTDGKTTL